MTRHATWGRVRVCTAACLGPGCSQPGTGSPTQCGLYLRVGLVAPTWKSGELPVGPRVLRPETRGPRFNSCVYCGSSPICEEPLGGPGNLRVRRRVDLTLRESLAGLSGGLCGPSRPSALFGDPERKCLEGRAGWWLPVNGDPQISGHTLVFAH